MFNQSKFNMEQAKTTIPIEQVFRDYLGVDIRFRGNVGKAVCSFHADKDPSLVVYRNTNRFYCHGCGQHGTTIDVVMLALRLPFKDAARHFMQTYGLQTGDNPEARKRFERIQKEREWKEEFRLRVDTVYQLLACTHRVIFQRLQSFDGYMEYGNLESTAQAIEQVLDELQSGDTARQRAALEYVSGWLVA